MKQYNILDCIQMTILNKYHITILIEDIMMYYNFYIYEDNVKNDLRTVVLKNNKKDTIIINSNIVSYSGSGEIFKQQNKIIYIADSINKKYEWDYVGSTYKISK